MKKQIKLMSASVLTLIVAGALAPPASVLAEPVEETYTGWGAVGFEVPTDPTDPVDPEDPSEPIDPDDPDQPGPGPDEGTPGPLSIDFASNFYFGSENPISGIPQTLNARLQPTTDGDRPNFVQVTDARGVFTGWNLQVEASEFVVPPGQPHEGTVLTGAQISWRNGTIVSPVSEDIRANGHHASRTLIPGAPVDAMWADDTYGAGTNLLRFGTTDGDVQEEDDAHASTSVQLNIPAGVARETLYMATITWTISDTPGQQHPDPDPNP